VEIILFHAVLVGIPIVQNSHDMPEFETFSPQTSHYYLAKGDSQFVERETYYGVALLVGSIQLQVSFEKEPYKRDNILQRDL